MSYTRDDSSIDIMMEFIDSDDESLFVRKQKPKKSTAKRKSTTKDAKAKKRKRKPKPADMPRRPLSAYNLFFKEQRALIIGAPNVDSPRSSSSPSFERKKRAHRKTHGKISFSNLAKEIGKNWNALPEEGRSPFVAGASKEKLRYQEELRVYKLKKEDSKLAKSPGADRGGNSTNSALKRERNQNDPQPCRNMHNNCDSSPNHQPSYLIKDSPYGIEVQFKQEDPYEESLEDFNPLPITYDPLYNPAEHIDNREMVKLVAPLLSSKNKKHRSLRRLPTSYIVRRNHSMHINGEEDSRQYASQSSSSYRTESSSESRQTAHPASQDNEAYQPDQSVDAMISMFFPSSEEKKQDHGNDYSSSFQGNLFPL